MHALSEFKEIFSKITDLTIVINILYGMFWVVKHFVFYCPGLNYSMPPCGCVIGYVMYGMREAKREVKDTVFVWDSEGINTLWNDDYFTV